MGVIRDSFVIFKSWSAAINELPDEYQLETYKALMSFAETGEIPQEISQVTKAMLVSFSVGMSNSIARYNASIENGKKGGRPSKKEDNQPEPNSNQSEPSIKQSIPSKTQPEPSLNLDIKNNNLEKPRITQDNQPEPNPNLNVNDNVNVIVVNNITESTIHTRMREELQAFFEEKCCLKFYTENSIRCFGSDEAVKVIVGILLDALCEQKEITIDGIAYKHSYLCDCISQLNSTIFASLINSYYERDDNKPMQEWQPRVIGDPKNYYLKSVINQTKNLI